MWSRLAAPVPHVAVCAVGDGRPQVASPRLGPFVYSRLRLRYPARDAGASGGAAAGGTRAVSPFSAALLTFGAAD
jgi:hypothetical protein